MTTIFNKGIESQKSGLTPMDYRMLIGVMAVGTVLLILLAACIYHQCTKPRKDFETPGTPNPNTPLIQS